MLLCLARGYLTNWTHGQSIKTLPLNGFKNMFVQLPFVSRLCLLLNGAAIADLVCNVSMKSELVDRFLSSNCLDYLAVTSPR